MTGFGLGYSVLEEFDDSHFKIVQTAMRRFQVDLVFRRVHTGKIRLQIKSARHGVFDVERVYGPLEIQKALGIVRSEADCFVRKGRAQQKL